MTPPVAASDDATASCLALLAPLMFRMRFEIAGPITIRRLQWGIYQQ
jgi:hypothetical protein